MKLRPELIAGLPGLFFGAALIFGCSGQSVHQSPSEHSAPPPECFFHTVRYQGETLGLISRWYTGSAANWVKIAELTPGLDVRRMPPGTSVCIPRPLVKREAPLPKPVLPPKPAMPPKPPATAEGTAVTTPSAGPTATPTPGVTTGQAGSPASAKALKKTRDELLREMLEDALR